MTRHDQKDNNTSNRGFASMDKDRQREVAAQGGRSTPAEERTFSKDPKLASEAGRKGGENSQGNQHNGNNRANGHDREYDH